MNENLFRIYELIEGNWYSKGKTIQYNIDPHDNDEVDVYEGNFIKIASKPLEQNTIGRYRLYNNNGAAHIKIDEIDCSIEEISKDKATLKHDNDLVTLVK